MNHKALESWREEKRSAYLYRLVSDAESGTARQMLFLELAQAAERQAELWQAEIGKAGATLSLFTGRKAWRGGARMLLIGAAAGAATWAIGRALGVALS